MIAIWGAAGAIGRAFAEELARRGQSMRVVGRSRGKLAQAFGDIPGAELCSADVATQAGCAEAAAGAEAIVYTLGLPYTKRAFAAYPNMMRMAVQAAQHAGVRKLILISNVYAYGVPRARPVDETHPREPASVKGRFRKEQEDLLLSAHGQHGLSTVSLRLPDFYGPHAELSFTHRILSAAVEGKTADVLGPVDVPHEFIHTPDVGPVLWALLAQERGYGEGYNLAGAGTITLREFTAKAFAAANHPLKMRVAGPKMVRFFGLFSSLMRELDELSYLLTTPVILDGQKLERLLGPIVRTDYDTGIAATLEHLRNTTTASSALAAHEPSRLKRAR